MTAKTIINEQATVNESLEMLCQKYFGEKQMTVKTIVKMQI